MQVDPKLLGQILKLLGAAIEGDANAIKVIQATQPGLHWALSDGPLSPLGEALTALLRRNTSHAAGLLLDLGEKLSKASGPGSDTDPHIGVPAGLIQITPLDTPAAPSPGIIPLGSPTTRRVGDFDPKDWDLKDPEDLELTSFADVPTLPMRPGHQPPAAAELFTGIDLTTGMTLEEVIANFELPKSQDSSPVADPEADLLDPPSEEKPGDE